MAHQANQRLRAALTAGGLGIDELAKGAGVDRKTVERWLSGRTPYRHHQVAVADLLGVEPAQLWPNARLGLSSEEVTAVYPNRTSTPPGLWPDTLQKANEHLDVLVFAGFWLSEDPAFRQVLAERASAGVEVRIALGDPDSEEVARRGEEEQIGRGTIAAKIRNTIVNYRDLLDVAGITFRLHAAPLYNSIYRADDQMLVNPHVYGQSAYAAPILHVQRTARGALFATYQASFERIWATATPLTGPLEA